MITLSDHGYFYALGFQRVRDGSQCIIHLFPAVPAPIALLCGRELLPKADPSLMVYDYVDNKQGFKFALQVN